ncbi:17401_t:CDS:2 [Acaulospora morrowiae]|uniref:17401_t:CDS:1 n=1 Tax=Acaulospora morrowiae TaxID=94023 RepID=A0A9N8YTY4_9GLOM|nr:17401_t:CDS:2 [Acaulospora morrowiae]
MRPCHPSLERGLDENFAEIFDPRPMTEGIPFFDVLFCFAVWLVENYMYWTYVLFGRIACLYMMRPICTCIAIVCISNLALTLAAAPLTRLMQLNYSYHSQLLSNLKETSVPQERKCSRSPPPRSHVGAHSKKRERMSDGQPTSTSSPTSTGMGLSSISL